MAATESDLVNRLLKQSILTLCREAVSYMCHLEVDGIVCLTVDDRMQYVVKIHEVFGRQENGDTISRSRRDGPVVMTSGLQRQNRNDSPGRRHEERARLREMAGHPATADEHTITHNEESIFERINDRPAVLTTRNNDGRQTPTSPLRKSTPIDLSLIKQEPQDFKVNSSSETNIGESAVSNSLTEKDYKKIGLHKVTLSSATNIMCKKCDIIIESVGRFEEHNMTVHGHFTCLICLATFTSRNNMKRHIRLHTGIKPYSCHKCPESFSRNDDFKRHLLKHTFQKPFRCAVCKTGYSDRACIRGHMMKEHAASVYHICPRCGETFLDLHRFQQHKEKHPELEDYRCSVCSFTGSNALMYHKHMLTHGPSKVYSCQHCKVTFPDPFTYTGHLKQHKGDDHIQVYVCCFCDMSLSTFEQFQRHEHTHIHPKQHVCRECNKVFRYPSNLREHMVTHLSKAGLLDTCAQTDNTDAQESSIDGSEYKNSPVPHAGEDSSSEDGKMETEENNNHMDRLAKCETDTEVSPSDNISGSSEYWCTECNHGFGTENELQDHIIIKHEQEREDPYESNGATESDESKYDLYPSSMHRASPQPNAFIQLTRIPEPCKDFMFHSALKALGDFTSSNQTHKTIFQAFKPRAYDEENVPGSISDMTKSTLTVPGKRANFNSDVVRHLDRKSAEVLVAQPSQEFEYHYVCTSVPTTVQEVNELDDDKHLDKIFDNTARHERAKSVPLSTVPMQSGKSISDTVSALRMKLQRLHHNLGAGSMPDVESEDQTERRNCGLSRNGENTDSRGTTPDEGSDSRPETPGRTTTSINLKVRNPGFERVVTPQVLFKTKAPFTCEICDETFSDFDSFHDHGVKVHRRYICSYCGKVFTSRPNRERHIRYHTGDRPYKCELCSLSFLRGDDLKYHRTTRHADVKPFVCASCQSAFSLPKELEKHLKIHPDHKM